MLYTDSTTGFGSSSLNKDKNASSREAVSLLQRMYGIQDLAQYPGSFDN